MELHIHLMTRLSFLRSTPESLFSALGTKQQSWLAIGLVSGPWPLGLGPWVSMLGQRVILMVSLPSDNPAIKSRDLMRNRDNPCKEKRKLPAFPETILNVSLEGLTIITKPKALTP